MGVIDRPPGGDGADFGQPDGIDARSGAFDARASAAGRRQSSLHEWIHRVPRIECTGAQAALVGHAVETVFDDPVIA